MSGGWVVIDCGSGFAGHVNGADAIEDVYIVGSLAEAIWLARRLRAELDRDEDDEDPPETAPFDPDEEVEIDDDIELHGPTDDPFGFYAADDDGMVRSVGRRLRRVEPTGGQG